MGKKVVIAFAIAYFSSVSSLIGCATCIGRLKKGDEPFFSDSYYQSMTRKIEDPDAYGILADYDDYQEEDEDEEDAE